MSPAETAPKSSAPESISQQSCCAPACCGGASSESPGPGTDVRAAVRERYGRIAAEEPGAAGCCGGPEVAEAVLGAIGYTPEQAKFVPEGSNLGLGCGNPIQWTGLKPGETVLDLGSGAGIDCFLAAREVGPSGHVIGVDMTPAMIERARANSARGDWPQVEFRLGEIEHLPVADASVDAIISNCVVNLSPDKAQVFREARRALRPGGRMVVSDLVWLASLPDSIRRDVDQWVGCVAGASLKEDYLALIRAAGFRDVEVVDERGYSVGSSALPEGSAERTAFESVASIKVRAVK